MSETDVTLVMGKPVGSGTTRKNSVALKLQELNLDQYEQELIDEQGYDSVDTLKELSPDELTQLADDCKMKPGHKKKLHAARRKSDTALRLMAATETKPANPAVDPNMIALKEQNEEMMKQMTAFKKQQSADRLKKDLEERENKIKVRPPTLCLYRGAAPHPPVYTSTLDAYSVPSDSRPMHSAGGGGGAARDRS
eukprot:scaffold114808_cov67-Phaeocystis_antarctica.AAC.4